MVEKGMEILRGAANTWGQSKGTIKKKHLTVRGTSQNC